MLFVNILCGKHKYYIILKNVKKYLDNGIYTILKNAKIKYGSHVKR